VELFGEGMYEPETQAARPGGIETVRKARAGILRDAVAAVVELGDDPIVLDAVLLEAEQARYDLEVVLHPKKYVFGLSTVTGRFSTFSPRRILRAYSAVAHLLYENVPFC